MEQRVDVVVVGAGPAGLAAGLAAASRGASVIVIEAGKSSAARGREASEDLVRGVGGVGLFSDGKFSFAPSATKLWELEPVDALRDAYEWASAQLGTHGVAAPRFADEGSSMSPPPAAGVKPYPSQYMTLEGRLALIGEMEETLGHQLVVAAESHLQRAGERIAAKSALGRVVAQAAVLATGRFGPLRLPGWIPADFRRVEIGMRVEQRADRFALDTGALRELLDPKWIRRSADGRYEWRTFCCCRDGEVIESEFEGMRTVSGRADGPATGLSNFGLNVRFLHEREAAVAMRDALDRAAAAPVMTSVADLTRDPFRSAAGKSVGPRAAEALAAGIAALQRDLDVDLRAASLHLPALEGVGYYPTVNETLRVGRNVWVAGDATGIFRGLVPALVSGWLAGAAAADAATG